MNAKQMKLALVYQGGIANLVRVEHFCPQPEGRKGFRYYQGDFHTAEAMARGAMIAGANVESFGCNEAGDIREREWTTELEELPFFSSMIPVHSAT